MSKQPKRKGDPGRERRGNDEGAIVFWLHQAQHAVRAEILRLFRERGHDLTAEQWTVLAAVWQRPGQSQAELARITGRDKPGVTRLVDGLERKGFVQRVLAEDDRRRYALHPTEAGARLHDVLEPIVGEVVGRALEGFSTADKSTARDLLRRLVLNLRDAK